MKFESITMENFMRYKGRNHIEFSCDDVKNVTVVLGDNTVGKTTIAQAFRWGLYGALMAKGRHSVSINRRSSVFLRKREKKKDGSKPVKRE